MLKIVAGVSMLLVIAFLGYRRTFTGLRLPIGARLLFLTGTEYILVGFALGGGMLGLLDEPTVLSLTPLFGLGLGVIGLILGIQVEVKLLGRFPSSWVRMAVVQGGITALLVFVPCHLALGRLFGRIDRSVLLAALVMAAAAACTAQTALALIQREFRLRGSRLLEQLRFMSGLDALVGVIPFGLAFCLMHAASPVGLEIAVGLQWFIVSVGLGAVFGGLLHLLTRIRCREEELFVFVAGLVLFAAGLSSYLRLSPLFVCMTMGLVATNLPGSKTRILHLLGRLEKPTYVVFLVLAGAVWQPGSPWALPLAGLYLSVRVVGKVVGGYVASRTVADEPRPPGDLGLGLISQGGVVIAMMMSYYHASPAPETAVVVTAVLIAVIVSELFGPSIAMDLLRREGELRT